ncbi:MAG: hypothetical protein QOC55_2562 [Thermoleophilaceae bacterium]|jgi:hypothetical protein|nr:hypothetical protein [Thermoleophilaceae bacterium]
MQRNEPVTDLIPEHKQLTRLQAYLIASSAWSWVRRARQVMESAAKVH